MKKYGMLIYIAAKERLMEAFPLYTDQVAPATEEAKDAFAESDHQAVMEGLKKTLVSLEHIDFDQIRAATEAYKEAKLRRSESSRAQNTFTHHFITLKSAHWHSPRLEKNLSVLLRPEKFKYGIRKRVLH